MFFFESHDRPNSASSDYSLGFSATEMIQGWTNGLRCKYDVGNIECMTAVKYTTPKVYFGRGRKDAGDINLVMRFTCDDGIRLENILPERNYKISPEIAKSWEFNGFMCNAKRISGIKSADQYINQFVKFYTGLLQDHSEYLLNGSISSSLHAIINDVNTPIVFLFNGSDFVDVWKKFLVKVPTLKICGHYVCFVFCLYEGLISWETAIIIKRETDQLEEGIRVLRRERMEIQREREEIQRERMEIQRERMEIQCEREEIQCEHEEIELEYEEIKLEYEEAKNRHI